ncbi:hypothetical protein MCOR27_009475 [Pyricularia oryzae]|uniref:G8 domain-containing protein n=2 Tax=Pyricularia TaxID=48558 RepID=A0ABQ8NDI7_PYRGI|nr:hypothetical protein MCOR01_009797 [Pyricularia oryzae]KAI6295309.1 hypothetical protein MCOR33_007757 [Pyricularia grisea]KAH9436905.1 hypothetical protein MCOR02_000569 [Pyricularia oryzae]KAI6260775.1 hypothetical protein MCOR19_002991 [Pyricularia oryzae]KAI6270085.1 hypothetical protein MCOR27_009475 [Pyricularia oryzae]
MLLLLLAIKVLVCHVALASAEAIADGLWQETRNASDFTQQGPVKSAWIITPESSITRQGHFTVDADDMVTVVVPSGTHWEADGLEVANGASAILRNVNVQANDGSIGLFVHGASVALNGAKMSSSGPVGHSVFAAGGGFINMSGISAITTGPRSSIAAASTLYSRVRIENSQGLTFGPGSPCLFSLGGSLNVRQFKCVSFRSPFLVVDSTKAVWQDRLVISLDQVEAEAGGLAAIVMFDNTSRPNARPTPWLRVNDTVIKAIQPEAVGMWLSNTGGRVDMARSTIIANGTLVRAVAAGMPAWDGSSGFEKRHFGDESTAVIFSVAQSSLRGDIVVSGRGGIDLQLKEMSEWVGSAVAEHSDSHVHVDLSRNSIWRLTNHTHVQKLMDDDPTLGNIDSQGFNLTYCKNVSNIAVPVSPLAGGGFAVGLPV